MRGVLTYKEVAPVWLPRLPCLPHLPLPTQTSLQHLVVAALPNVTLIARDPEKRESVALVGIA